MSCNHMKKNIISIAAMMAVTIALIAVSYYVKKNHKDARTSEYVQYDFVMGTSMTQTLYPGLAATDRESLPQAASEIAAAVERLDNDILSWRNKTSEVAELNAFYTENTAYIISSDLMEITEKSLDICEKTDGALDITLRPLANVWNIEGYNAETDGKFVIPAQQELERAAEKIGYEHIKLLKEDSSIEFDIAGMTLDFGAVGKGYALDIIYDIVKEKSEIGGCVIAVGGSILVYGEKWDGTSFQIGIRDPAGSENEVMGRLTVNPGSGRVCISTSGNYEKYVVMGDKRYHHILDRRNLAPAESGLVSVTVYCMDGLYSDGLSTACFVLGYEKSLPILKQYHAEAVFIDAENNVYVTDGLKKQFTITNSRYRLAD